MTIKSIVFDEESINIFASAIITENWFDNFQMPAEYNDRINRVIIDDSNLYFLSRKANIDSKLLVVNIDNSGLFGELDTGDKVTAFDRIIVIALNRFGEAISPGKSWGKYVNNCILSIYATHKYSQRSKRIYFDTNPLNTNHVFAFKLTVDISNQFCTTNDENLFIESEANFEKALNEKWQDVDALHSQKEPFGLELTETLSGKYGNSFTLNQWYESKLTSEQRLFVDKSFDEPVRLKGAAGTGKTLALVVKFLRDAYLFEKSGEKKRLLFITHSHATSQLVLDLILSMDEQGLWGGFNYVSLKVSSLYDLAQDLLNYNLKNIKPLSTDGNEGRKYQFEIAEEILNNKLKDYRFKVLINKECSTQFKDFFLNKNRRKELIFEILNEFSCILDAEKITLGSPLAEKYLTGSREIWQMNLTKKEDREAILELHDDYRTYLRELEVLSMDQMIADLNLYLMSHEWSLICNEQGFDAIFIDELHYFTRPERMIFHELYRNTSSSSTGKIPLFMAYDIKQSTDDTFLYSMITENAGNLVKSTKVGATKLVELTKVFRYTPEIANFLNDIDGSFPALDLPSEWKKLALTTDNKKSTIPTLVTFNKNIELIDSVFKEASRIAKKDYRKTVAILCINNDLFVKYLNVGRIKELYKPIKSRDEVVRINRLKGKCIFSMPEYVAGLQFDTVYIIHLDKNEVDEETPHCGLYRRFVSRVYLGASRARTTLKISASLERRGPSQILESAIENGSILKQ